MIRNYYAKIFFLLLCLLISYITIKQITYVKRHYNNFNFEKISALDSKIYSNLINYEDSFHLNILSDNPSNDESSTIKNFITNLSGNSINNKIQNVQKDQIYQAQLLKNQFNQLEFQPTELPICSKVISNNITKNESDAIKLYNLESKARIKKYKDQNIENSLFNKLSEGFLSEEDYNLFLTNHDTNTNSDNNEIEKSKNCKIFKNKRQYITKPLSYEEQNYPIAYSIVIHKDIQSFERLLRSIYHPQNYYCIHIDQKSSTAFKNAIFNLISCFNNVFHPKVQEKVYYLHWSRVQADINCLKELSQYNYKYVFNLCGQDYPIKTNLQLIRDLKGLNGHNENESVDVEKVGKLNRIMKGYDLNLESENDHQGTLVRNEAKDKQPNNLHYAPMLGKETGLFAGSAYFLFKKEAINFMLNDKNVQLFFKWMENSWSPDEALWATLTRYSKLPGSYGNYPSHIKYEGNEFHTRVRLVKWYGLERPDKNVFAGYNDAKFVQMYDTCHGQWLRGICIYGFGDVPWLLDSRHWFANKFDPIVDSLAIDCVDIYLRNKALSQSFSNIYH